MPKTPLRSKVLTNLAGFNDQMCFHLFLAEEFSERLSRLGPRAMALYTDDIFGSNDYAPKIHVRVGALGEFRKKGARFSLSAYFVSSYEVVAHYLDEVLELLGETNAPGFVPSHSQNLGPEGRLRESLAQSSYTPISEAPLDTIAFFRIRRNLLIHASARAEKSLAGLASSKGTSLNQYWRKTSRHIDFANPSLDPLAEEEAIDYLKILRIAFEEIDSAVGNLVAPVGALRYVGLLRLGTQAVRMNSEVAERRAKTLIADAKRGFGLTCLESDAAAVARSIGVRA